MIYLTGALLWVYSQMVSAKSLIRFGDWNLQAHSTRHHSMSAFFCARVLRVCWDTFGYAVSCRRFANPADSLLFVWRQMGVLVNTNTGAYDMYNLTSHAVNSVSIGHRLEDGYLNATRMCKASGKMLADYHRLQQTKDFLQALSGDMGIPITELFQPIRGGNPKLQGTWVHPKVAIHLAQWLSPEFAVQVTNWVFEWMNGNKQVATAGIPFANGRVLIWLEAGNIVRTEAVGQGKHLVTAEEAAALLYKADIPIPMPKEQREAFDEPMNRLMNLFHPLSQPFSDLLSIGRLLKGRHPKHGIKEPRYLQILPAEKVA